MKKTTIIFTLLLSLIVSTSMAETEVIKMTVKKHQFGLRMGTWSNNGTSPPDVIVVPPIDSLSAPTDSLITSIKNVNFYIEGFYAYNIFSSLFTEISFGMVNRGDMQVYSSGTYDFSNVLLYPILLQLKFYPLHTLKSKFQPFIGAGGGVYFGKQNIQFTNNYYTRFYQLQGDSETDFNYTVSGGFDWELRSKFFLDFQVKYMPIKFSNYFVGVKDYSATTITIGIQYKYNNKKK